MDRELGNFERRKRRAFQRLGSDHPQCVLCPVTDWQILELHHVAGRAFAEDCVILCRNCHGKLSYPDENEPQPLDAPLLERIGNKLIGWGELLVQLGQQLIASGKQLLQAVNECPWPWGWQEPQTGSA
jgi:hypothetical protein